MALLERSHHRVRGYKGFLGQCRSIELLCRWSWLPTGPSRSTEPVQQLEENIQKAEPHRVHLTPSAPTDSATGGNLAWVTEEG